MTTEGRMQQLIARAALVALALLLLWNAGHFLLMAVRAVGYPYELDYGEGIVWYQMRELFAGQSFGDIDRFPAIVFHYTPLFHVVTGALAATGIDGLAAGRIVSLISTMIMAALVAAIVGHAANRDGIDRKIVFASASAAGLLLLVTYPVKAWAPLMRVDMLAFALTLGGVLLGLKAIERPRFIYGAALLFVAAVYTKQTMIAAPAALFIVLLLARPSTAWKGIATCIVAGSVVLGALALATDGGFLRHVFLYNVNRLDPSRLKWIAEIGMGHALLIAAALIGLVSQKASIRAFFARRRDADARETGAAFLAIYFLLTTLLVGLVAKSGSSVNYFIEWAAMLCVYAGFALAATLRHLADPQSGKSSFGTLVVPIALAAQVIVIPITDHKGDDFSRRVEGLESLVERVNAAEKPVISDDMIVLIRGGQRVSWEPAIFAELGAKGVWDERPFVEMIEQERFAFFVTVGRRGEWLFDQRYNPAVADAMDEHYPRLEKVAGLTLHLPSE